MNFRASRLPRLVASVVALAPLAAQADDWYSWRGPTQDGRSAEKYAENVFPDAPDWTFDISGRGAPVIAKITATTAPRSEERIDWMSISLTPIRPL